MEIEIKLAVSNIKNNIKRTIFTITSIILCTVLIFTTVLLISSIRNGITENVESQYNDYHFIVKDIDMNSFSKIKDKEYIDKIYIQEYNKEQLYELKRPYTSFKIENNINVYIKYKDIKKVCDYSTDIINSLGVSDAKDRCEFNQKLLTVYGLIDVEILEENDTICRARINYSFVIDIMIILILFSFSILFIVILYNAFLITINERKKEYAILNSIGGTEGQILKIIFIEGFIMGTIGIIIGGFISYLSAYNILKILNDILINTGYNFRLVIDIKYVILSIFIIIVNIYISSIIPSVKASKTTIIEGIRNNNEIKYKKRDTILEKILPIEGQIAIKNIKRNKNKFRVITVLLVVCMTLYIAVSTYINYEKETSDLVSEYDIDAEIRPNSALNMDYKSIFDNYELKYGDKIEYMEYKLNGLVMLVEPKEAIITDYLVREYEKNQKSVNMVIIGLDDKTYTNYINKLNANYGDIIIYNNGTRKTTNNDGNLTYTRYPILKQEDNIKLSVIATYNDYENDINEFEIIDNENLSGNIVLTNEIIEGYKEIKMRYGAGTIFVNNDVYDKIEENFLNYTSTRYMKEQWINGSDKIPSIKIKCNNIIGFSKYMEDINRNHEMDVVYYSLQNQEKVIYIKIIQLILNIIMIAIITLGIVSTINILNASLCERKQDFKILYDLGATKTKINKIMIYECIYMFIKATIITIILSIPILYGIIKYMENIIVLSGLFIPFKSIVTFLTIILLISLVITIHSTKIVKNQ